MSELMTVTSIREHSTRTAWGLPRNKKLEFVEKREDSSESIHGRRSDKRNITMYKVALFNLFKALCNVIGEGIL